MTFVVDASIACKWVLKEPDSDLAHNLLISGEQLIAPAIILAEMANVFWHRSHVGEIDHIQASTALAGARMMISHIEPIDTLIESALDLSIRLGHPIYDCLYLALAHSENCVMITADKRFAKRASAMKLTKFVRLLTG
ncbi:MAG: type II toxin-antitoxin system VapC family toxin [Pseudomonadota bacterium]